jgi:hypothetical protein
MEKLIVTRHPAALQFLAQGIHPEWAPAVLEGQQLVWKPIGPEAGSPEALAVSDSVRIISGNATAEDVRNKIVYGNIPLHLAALARAVIVIEFSGDPPRGQEYGLPEMLAAGAHLTAYEVHPIA